jgi:hypothetical protein
MLIESVEPRRFFSVFKPTANPPVVVTLTASTTAVLTLRSGETFNGNGYTVGGVSGVDVSNVVIENLAITNSSGTGSSGSGISIDADRTGISNLTIQNVTVSGFANGYGVLIGTVGKGAFSNIKISDVNAFNNGDAGISTYGAVGSISNFTLTNSSTYDNPGIAGSNSPSGSGIMLAGLSNATVEYCVAYGNGANNNAADGPVGIFAYNSTKLVISNCQSYDNMTNAHDGGGFDLDGGVTNSQIVHCQSWGNAGYGFADFTYAGGAVNSNNVFSYDVSTGDLEGFVFWSNGPAIKNLTISSNQFLNPTSGDATLGGTGSGYSNIVMLNNTDSAGSQNVIEA